MRIVMTGADGFIGKNLQLRLRELGETNVFAILSKTNEHEAQTLLNGADFVFHLAGVNRPGDPAEFASGNSEFTKAICSTLKLAGRRTPLVLTSSTQAVLDNPYGRSKLEAESHVRTYAAETGAPVHIFRLTNVFGKWSRPNYNSVVATFCHNRAHNLPLRVDDPLAKLQLVYIDDVIESLLSALRYPNDVSEFAKFGPVYNTTVGEVAGVIESFRESRQNLITPRVGTGLVRALYSTFLSYLEPNTFDYQVPVHTDERGEFVEMLKTPDCGQFSYFTAHPGVTRGEHYHHTKAEKFLVIKGTAHFGFRDILTGRTHELVSRGGEARIVETIPGWTHNITNIGDDELVVMLWASEIFDRDRPDTQSMRVKI